MDTTGWVAAGQALREAREARGRTLADVATIADSHGPSWQSRVETGRGRPSPEEIRRILAYLDMGEELHSYLLFQWWGTRGIPAPGIPASGVVLHCPKHGGYIHECPFCAVERRGTIRETIDPIAAIDPWATGEE